MIIENAAKEVFFTADQLRAVDVSIGAGPNKRLNK
jgi:hypothetical protein